MPKPTPASTRSRRSRTLLSATILGSALAASPAAGEDWGSWGRDGQRWRQSSEKSGAAFGADWSRALPGDATIVKGLVASPAVADGFVAFGGIDRILHVGRAHDGRELWTKDLEGELVASPVVYRGRVIATSTGGHLQAFRVETGAILWRTLLGGLTYGSPVLVKDATGDGIIVAPGFPTPGLVRIDLHTGAVVWRTAAASMPHVSHSSVAIAEVAGRTLAITGAVGGSFHAVDAATGAVVWKHASAGDVYITSPVVVGTTVYGMTGGDEGRLHAIDAATGQPVSGWPVSLPLVGPVGVGARLARHVAKSSPVAAGDLLLVQARFIDLYDTNADNAVDNHDMRETLYAYSRTTRQLVWTLGLDARVGTRTELPTMTTCPTPAVFAGASGPGLVAVSSTLGGSVKVVDLADGTVKWTGATGAATRGSPTFANGRLFVGTDAGVLHAFASSANRPPDAPQVSRESIAVPSADPMLRWSPRPDLDGDMPQTIVRLDRDGEVLEDWEHELSFSPGVAQGKLPALAVEATYSYAFRARDAQGALSSWSPRYQLVVAQTPEVSVGGMTKGSLVEALAAARPGDVVTLGAGTFILQAPLSIPAGVKVIGAGPSATTLSGEGLVAAVTLSGRASIRRTELARVTIAGAAVGVDATDASFELRNVVIRDNEDVGVRIAAGATGELSNLTITGSKTGVSAAGATFIRNSILFANDKGLVASAEGKLTSRYNDLFETRVPYELVAAHATDLDAVVAFVDRPRRDYHLQPRQPTTDKGDPGDPFDLEPVPNGERINLGAYGGTAEAESSRLPDPPEPGPVPGVDGGVVSPLPEADGGVAPQPGVDGGAQPMPIPMPGVDAAAASDGAAPALPGTEGGVTVVSPTDQAGCNCAVPGGRRGPAGGWFLMALVGAGLAWRRRRP